MVLPCRVDLFLKTGVYDQPSLGLMGTCEVSDGWILSKKNADILGSGSADYDPKLIS